MAGLSLSVLKPGIERLRATLPPLARLAQAVRALSAQDFRALLKRPARKQILKEAGLFVIAGMGLALAYAGLFGSAGEGGDALVLPLSGGGVPDGETAAHTQPSGAGADERHGEANALPEIAADGRTPAQQFSRAAPAADGRAMVSVVITGLGISEERTREVLRQMPADVSLAFSPYAENLAHWVAEARRKGHEYFLEVPLEPFDYPVNDPGGLTLLTEAPPADNVRRLREALASAGAYVGVLTSGRTRFATDEAALAVLAGELKARGLALVDDGSAPISKTARIARAAGVPAASVDRRLDLRPTEDGIALRLVELERLANDNGRAIGASEAYPAALTRLAHWIGTLESKGLVLVPLSSQILYDDHKTTSSAAQPAKDKPKTPKAKQDDAHGH